MAKYLCHYCGQSGNRMIELPKETLPLRMALEMAIGLRKACEYPGPGYDAFWTSAFNCGMREYGGDDSAYDPLLHEDCTGGLLPGDACRVTKKGWVYDGNTLLRAQVAP